MSRTFGCFLCYMVLYFVFFFFFQAEDGIRDLTVTGVQTCALPISSARCRRRWRLPNGDHHSDDALQRHVTRSEERRVGKSVDLGGRRIIKKKKNKNNKYNKTPHKKNHNIQKTRQRGDN